MFWRYLGIFLLAKLEYNCIYAKAEGSRIYCTHFNLLQKLIFKHILITMRMLLKKLLKNTSVCKSSLSNVINFIIDQFYAENWQTKLFPLLTYSTSLTSFVCICLLFIWRCSLCYYCSSSLFSTNSSFWHFTSSGRFFGNTH